MLRSEQPPKFDQEDFYGAQLGGFLVAAQCSPMPTMITDSLTRGFPIIFANKAFLEMSGFDRIELIGNPVASLFGTSADGITLSVLESAIAGGKAGQWQISIRRANNTTLLSVIYLSPIFNDDGKVINHVVNIFDLSAMLCMSRDRKEIYPAVYDKAPGFIAISNGKDHKITYANASFKAFVKRDGMVGKTVVEALPEVVPQGIIGVLDEVYETGNPFRGTDMPIGIWDAEQGKLESRWMDVVYHPVRDESGAIVGLFCEGYDVTDLHEANEDLAVLQMKLIHVSRVNAMGTMAATLAHELNQPLTAISNYVAGARPIDGQEPDINRLSTAISGIKDASERASGIIEHLRQMTKHSKPSREPFKLMEAVNDCVRLVRSSFPANIVFDNQIADQMIMTADRVKIQQVLINLLKNACEAMADTDCAVVTIAALQDDLNLTVCVADTGTGVPPEAAATMFAWTGSTKDDGMGIGLSICRTIVELYCGSIWLERSGPEGSEFRFSLPVSGEANRDDAGSGSPAR